MKIARLLTDLPEKELTGRELARLLGVSHSSVQEAMRVFVASGLAVRRSVGRAHLYRTNRESYLFSTLQNLFLRERRVHDGLVSELRTAFGEEVISIILFGSYAKGTANPKSDIDVLVVSLDVGSSEDSAHSLGARFLRRYSLRLSAKVITPKELGMKRNAPFIRAARDEGLVIAGKPLDEVMRSGG
jgi:predicted nucleotidyltransferase